MNKKSPAQLAPFLDFDDVVCPPKLGPQHRLKHLVDSVAGAKTVSRRREGGERAHYWGAERFRLNQSSLYLSLSEEQKLEVLSLMTRHILLQGSTIEKTALSYTAKMTLISDSLDEKMLYAMIANDEAIHLREFENFAVTDADPAELKSNTFFKLLHQAIQHGSKSVCHAFCQVILEGFGMHFYSDLKNDCLDPELAQVLSRILKDEAAHHGSGIILCENIDYSPSELAMLRELFHGFTITAQCWALPIVGAVEKVAGHLSRDQKARLLADIGMEEKTAAHLKGLRLLINHGKLASQIGAPWTSGTPDVFSISKVLDVDQQLTVMRS